MYDPNKRVWPYLAIQLKEVEIAALIAFSKECSYSLGAHVPIGAVQRNFPSHLRGDAKKALEKLARKGYCIKHPTRGGMTFQLSRFGLEEAKRLEETPNV